MHSYLICSGRADAQAKIDQLVKKLGAEVYEFKIEKIEEVRELNSFTKLKVEKPTAIIIKSIENATTEAANAFLKNLEEPQANLNFILTTSSVYKVLPTIVSRCQIVRIAKSKPSSRAQVEGEQIVNRKEIERFLEMSTGERLKYVDTIRNREEATSFIEQVILSAHSLLHETSPNYPNITDLLKKANSTLLALMANGNVTLQLTNFVVNS